MTIHISVKKLLSIMLLGLAVSAVPIVSQAYEDGYRSNHYQNDHKKSNIRNKYKHKKHNAGHNKYKYSKHNAGRNQYKYSKHNHKHGYDKPRRGKQHHAAHKYVKPRYTAVFHKKRALPHWYE